MHTTKKEILKEVRSYVANLGFTFKVNDRQYICNQTCYQICKRYTDEVVTDKYGNKLYNFTLSEGYDNMLNGYFDQLAQDKKHFNQL